MVKIKQIYRDIAALPPEKRKLLVEKLLQKQSSPSPAPEIPLEEKQQSLANPRGNQGDIPEPSGKGKILINNSPFSPESQLPSGNSKENQRKFYDSVSQQLDSSIFGPHALFLNYGFVADDTPQEAAVALPDRTINKNPIKLVLETIGNCHLTRRRILDVGCGRGGTVDVIAKYFQPQEIIGLDLSPQAIAFCRENYSYSHCKFLEGDAENLPFQAEEFDIVINIESSHNYPDIFQFYREVSRVLKRGGLFLYADLFPLPQLGEYLSYLQELGFSRARHRDITHNVLLSCDETARKHLDAFRKGNDPQSVIDFLAIPGSRPYNDMKNQKLTYRIVQLQKER